MASLRSDCIRWIRATWSAFAVFVAALLFVTAVAYQHHTVLSVGAGGVLAGASLFVGYRIRQERAHADYDASRARLVVTAGQFLAGLVLIGWSRAGGPDAAGFVGLAFAILFFGGVVSEARRSRWLEHRRGPIVLGAAFVAISAAVVLVGAPGIARVVAVGVALALLGAELYSEDFLRRNHEYGRAVVSVVGAGLVVVAGGLLVAGGADVLPAAVVLLVVVLLVWLASADSDSLLLVVVVAGALLWAGAPRPAAVPSGTTPVTGQPYFLVLGDSYISGEGASAFYDGTNTTTRNDEFTNQCRRAPTAWPNLLAGAGLAGVPTRVLFLPCSGAETRHVRATPPVDDHGRRNGPAELVEYEHRRTQLGLTQSPAFVLLSLGGNDAGFGTIAQTCVGPGDCAEVGHEFLDALNVVEPRLDQAYADISSVVGKDVPVIVAGYPIPITEHGPCATVLLTEHERRFVVAFVKELNRVVQSATERAGFEYIDTMEDALVTANSRLCEDLNPAGMNFIGFNPTGGSLWDTLNPTNWVHNSLHPNEAGHRALLDAVTAWFTAHPARHAPTPTGAPPRIVPNIDKLFEFGFTRLCDPHGDRSCDITHNGWANDQMIRLAQSGLLPLTLAAIGAWMIVIGPIGWAVERGVTTANVIVAAWRWLRSRIRRRPP